MICFPDFNGQDFAGEDFSTTTIAYSAHRFLFQRLPFYFKIEDSYKDSLNRGILERFMSIFADEIDQEFIPYIECYLNIHDAGIVEEEYLNYISDVLGNPPDIFQNVAQYRKILLNALSLYKVKGSVEGYGLFFKLLGYTFNIEALDVVKQEYYDSGINYDSGLIYKGCNPCYHYNVKFSSFIDNPEDFTIDAATIQALQNAINFNEPINANLEQLILGITIQDTMNATLFEDPTPVGWVTYKEMEYDVGLSYDGSGNNYDVGTQVTDVGYV